MPVFSDNHNHHSTISAARSINYKKTLLWSCLVIILVGTWLAGVYFVRSFQLQSQNAKLQSSNPEFRVFDALANSQHPYKINFVIGDSPDPNLTDNHTNGAIYLTKNRQVVNLEIQPTNDFFREIQPTLKILPQHNSYFLKLNLNPERHSLMQPLNLLANLTPYQEFTPHLQRLYNHPATVNLNNQNFSSINHRIAQIIHQQTDQQWLKLDRSLIKIMTDNNSLESLGLCFLSQSVFLNYRFWDVDNYNDQNQILHLKFNQAKFLQTLKRSANHDCFKGLQQSKEQQALINQFTNLNLLITVTPNNFFPQKIVAFNQADDKTRCYVAQIHFQILPDGIDSSEPNNFTYLSSLIKDLDREVSQFTKKAKKH